MIRRSPRPDTDRNTELDPTALIADDWRVSGRIYRDEQVFALEQERLFRRCWLYLAHESEIPEPGDYKTTWAGGQPVIVSRGADDGELYAMLNRCRHRGATVCQEETGNAHFYRCAYHGWTYNNDGSLRGLPYDKAYAELDRSALGLVPLGAVESFRGFVFGRLADEGPSLKEYLGNAAGYLERVADQGSEGIELTAGAHRLRYEGNWKLQLENTIDNYHFGFVHQSYLEIVRERTGKAPTIASNIFNNPDWRTVDLGNGHSVAEFGDPDSGGHQAGIGDLPFNLIVFPTLGFVGAQLRHVIPRSANETEVFLYPMLHRGASAEHNAGILRAHEGFYGPAGFGGTDDLEIAFNRVGVGLRAVEDDWLMLSRGATTEQERESGIRAGHAADELPQRAFYRQWLRMMES